MILIAVAIEECMGRTEFLTWNDYERAWDWYGTYSTRAKWRSSPSACGSVLKKCLTHSALSGTPDFVQLTASPKSGQIDSVCL